ncbi:MAG: SGNH/GDSL hydrolase family protein [Jatrophihabitans sp.]|nr:MAG: SGNH/GDSL hydrolase family protein [Jatrophihabitans sp.]
MPPNGNSDQGYVDDLYRHLKRTDPSLVLVKLGCSGETTTTMIDGGVCTYPEGSQLAAAEAFLSAHRPHVRYLTLDIGANDVDGCAPGGAIDLRCVGAGLATIATNLHTILAGLRAADGGFPRSVAMTYYDPFLALWLTGAQGRVAAGMSVALLVALNTIEATGYGAYGFRVADVFGAYRTADFTPAASGLPVNVQTLCALTFMCTLANIHPNPTGYQVIADAFAAQLWPRRR